MVNTTDYKDSSELNYRAFVGTGTLKYIAYKAEYPQNFKRYVDKIVITYPINSYNPMLIALMDKRY